MKSGLLSISEYCVIFSEGTIEIRCEDRSIFTFARKGPESELLANNILLFETQGQGQDTDSHSHSHSHSYVYVCGAWIIGFDLPERLSMFDGTVALSDTGTSYVFSSNCVTRIPSHGLPEPIHVEMLCI